MLEEEDDEAVLLSDAECYRLFFSGPLEPSDDEEDERDETYEPADTEGGDDDDDDDDDDTLSNEVGPDGGRVAQNELHALLVDASVASPGAGSPKNAAP